jgi:hypothetical protein
MENKGGSEGEMADYEVDEDGIDPLPVATYDTHRQARPHKGPRRHSLAKSV